MNQTSDFTVHFKSQNPSLTIAGMGGCFAMGNFTDNFYKQCAIIIAASAQMMAVQSYATVLFSLPFILFSAWAGWLADYLPKKYIVVAAKTMELAALVFGGLMLVHGHWAGVLGALFCMGLQATFFSPALNGSIPEVFPLNQVPRVNSLIKLVSTAAVLAGIALAGIFLDLRPNGDIYATSWLSMFSVSDGEGYGRLMAAFFASFIAVLGLALSFTLQTRPSAKQKGIVMHAFPWAGPWDSMKQLIASRHDKQLFTVLLAEAYFYGASVIVIVSISNLAKNLGYSNTVTSLFSAAMMVGIAVGSLIVAMFSVDHWRRIVRLAGFGMALFMLAIALGPFLSVNGLPGAVSFGNMQLWWLFGMLFLCGVCGGFYLIPIASLIQILPPDNEKGRTLGISNFFSFVSIAIFGVLFLVISLMPPYLNFIIYGLMTALFVHSCVRKS